MRVKQAGVLAAQEVPVTQVTQVTPQSWVRPRPDRQGLRADFGLALLLAFAALTTSLLYHRTGIYLGETAAPWLWALGLGLCTLPLALRRRFPVPVAVTVAVGFFICGQFGVPEILIINICLFIALYTVGAWEQNRTLSAGSWRAARAQAQLEAQGRELELERRTSAEQAVALDRLGIARELHDVVAHHVSVMGIQAAAARRLIEIDGARAAAALDVVEASAQSAIIELRQLVQTLRVPESENASSTVGIAQPQKFGCVSAPTRSKLK